MHRIDGEGATGDNKFTEGNPSTGLLATTVTADWANAVQEEIVKVIEEAGIPLVKANNGQLFAAIQSLIAGGGVAVTADGVSIDDAGSYFTGTEVEAALQQLGADLYNGIVAASKVRRQVVALTGAAQQTEAGHAEALLEISHTSTATYTVRPDGTLNLPIGTAITIYQAGSGKVDFVGGAGVTILKGGSFNARTMEQHAPAVLTKTAANTWRLGGTLEAA